MHGGYFSDPAIADPFIGFVQKAIDVSKPGVIVDLGGGTGFVLHDNTGTTPIFSDMTGK